ncbi:MAG: glycosyltransferase [Patescibacteria group bacterium]|nr:glycosyltransferase [Patescibacteria group bacterium]
MNVTLSVIVPVAAYNVRWLDEAIESAVGVADELILVCDGDPELYEAARSDKRVTHVLSIASPGGPEAAINAGVAVATQSHFSVLCSDDCYLPDVAKVKEASFQGLITYGKVRFVGDMYGIPDWPVSDLQLANIAFENCVPSPAIVPRCWWFEVGGYENVRYCDWHFYKKLYHRYGLSAFCFKPDLIFYQYRAWSGTISAKMGYQSNLGH